MRGETVTLLGIYDRQDKLASLRPKQCGPACEIQRFVLPGTKIIFDAMTSYSGFPEAG